MMYHHSGYFTSNGEAGESGGHQHLSTINYSDQLASMANDNMIEEKMVLPTLFSNEGIELGLNLHHPELHLGLKQQQHCYDLAMLSNPSLMRMFAAGSLHYSPEMPTESVSSAHLLFPDHVPLFSEGLYPVSQDMKPKKPQKKKKSGPKVEKHEKERRERLNTKFSALKSLIPNPTKADRATVLADAIDYIHELLRTVDELKVLVENKRRMRQRRKGSVAIDIESSSTTPLMDIGCDNAMVKGGMRSSWLQRRSKETLVDVRIVEDEVTIKIDQRRKMDSLLVISKVLDELQLELLHLSTGNIGDYHVFFFNTKIHEGSSVYASAMAERLIEVIELQPQYHGC